MTAGSGAPTSGSGTGLAEAITASDSRSRRPVDCATQPCPLADTVHLTEIVEVVTHGGRTATRPVAAREQYINLDDQVDPGTAHPEYGREIRLKARMMWAGGDLSRRPIPTKTIYWYVTAGATNRAGLTGNELPAINGASSPLHASTPTDAEGWTSVVTLRLSTYGGDQFTAHATRDSHYTGGLAAGAFTVWRKFWYQMTEMARPSPSTARFTVPAAVITGFNTAYARVFARFAEERARTHVAHRDNLRDHGARGNYMNPVFRNNHKVPYKCHVASIDYASDIGQKTVSDAMRAATAQTGWIKLWNRGSGTHPWKIRARYRRGFFVWHCNRVTPACSGHNSPSDRCPQVSGAKWKCRSNTCPRIHSQAEHNCSHGPWTCRRTSPACGTHGARGDTCPRVEGAHWTCNAVGCPGHSQPSHNCDAPWQDIPDSAMSVVTHGTQPGWKGININLSSLTPPPSAAHPVQYELVVREYEGTYGWGGGSTLVSLCVGCVEGLELTANQTTLLTDILVHEIGHALGLINLPPAGSSAHNAWKDPVASHGRHCARPTTQCIMWYTVDTTTTTRFHLSSGGTGCHDYLRRQEFARGNMAHWRP